MMIPFLKGPALTGDREIATAAAPGSLPAVVLLSHSLVCLLLCAAVDPMEAVAPIVMGQKPRTDSSGEKRLCGFTQIPCLTMKIQCLNFQNG